MENAIDNCATKFKLGGKLAEPQSLQVKDLVYQASLEIFGGNYEVWLGCVYSEAKNDFVYRSNNQRVIIDAWCKTSFCLENLSFYFQKDENLVGTWNENGWFHYKNRTRTEFSICESL